MKLEAKIAEKGFRVIAGVDEVGRGSFAGPVVAGCVVFRQIPNSKNQITNNIQTTPEVTVSISLIQPKIPTSGNLLPTILMVIGGIFLLILGFAF